MVRNGAVALVAGTRPELVKLAPLAWALGDACLWIHSGQHRPVLLDPIRADLGLPTPAIACDIATGPPSRQIGDAVTAIGGALQGLEPDIVVVQGDTSTTLAGALAAAALGLPVVHVEAGLRAFDRELPEERNRVVVDHLADLLAAPTETARAHLLDEGIDEHRIVVTGNPVVDAARRCLPDRATRSALLERYGVSPAGYVVATFHRQENVDDPTQLATIVDQLAGLPLPVVFPVHPRARDRAERAGIDLTAGALRPTAPLGFADFLALEAACAFIVSDSGGVAEEASILARPVVIVRRSTERPEVLGTFATLVGPEELTDSAEALAADVSGAHHRLAALGTPFGDGRAGARIAAWIDDYLTNGEPARRRYDPERGSRDAPVRTH